MEPHVSGDCQDVLHLAVSLGETILKNGGEIYRTQETIGYVLDAYGIEDYNVFVITNGIMATIHETREDRASILRNVKQGDMNLERVDRLNQLSREISDHKYTLEEAWEKLKECQAIPEVRLRTRVLISAMGCGAMCYRNGGRPAELITAALLGMLLQTVLWALDKRDTSKYLAIILGAAMVTVLSVIPSHLGIHIQSDQAVIAANVLMVPGVAMASAIRDFFMENWLSGTIRLVDAVLTGICIAVGVGVGMVALQLFGGRL